MLSTYPAQAKKRRKKVVIINQSRFIIASVITLIFASLIFTAVTGLLLSSASSYETYTVISVVQGDTLWGIATEHNPYQLDVRAIVHDIKKQNQLKTADIYPGQLLIVPSK